MYGKIILNIIIILLLAIFQVSFISALPKYFNEINIIILVLVFVLSFSNLRFCLYWAMGFGLLLDIYSFSIFGTYLLIFPLVMLLANFLFINFFTNRSLYSLVALSIFSSILFKLLLFISSYFSYFFELKNYFLHIDFREEIKIIGIEIFTAVIFFYLFTYVNKNSRAVFLSKYKS